MKRPIFLMLATLLGAAAGGCKSDQTTICQRLDDCHLFPSGTSPEEPNGFTEQDCEYQVENELGSSNRQKCADCVTKHPCEQIQDACRTVCNPPY